MYPGYGSPGIFVVVTVKVPLMPDEPFYEG